jgi:hypothetical protein
MYARLAKYKKFITRYLCCLIVPVIQMAIVTGTITAFGETPSPTSWTDADASALRKLIAHSDVRIGSYIGADGFPHRRLLVPDQFVHIYRKYPEKCLSTLIQIVRLGTPHDALVAFQFGMAGDEPQITVPILAYMTDEELDRRYGPMPETNRQFLLRLLERTNAERQRSLRSAGRNQ